MYIELHARSAFSFLEGSSLPEDLAGICARLNMPAMALLDTDGVYGAPRFHMAMKKIDIKAHIGAEVTCGPSHTAILSGASASRSEALAESKDPYSRQSSRGIGIPHFARNDTYLRAGVDFGHVFVREGDASAPDFGQVLPFGIMSFNKCDLLRSCPAFDLLFVGYGGGNVFESPRVDEAIAVVFRGEPRPDAGSMLQDATVQVAGYAGVKGSGFAAEDVHMARFHQ